VYGAYRADLLPVMTHVQHVVICHDGLIITSNTITLISVLGIVIMSPYIYLSVWQLSG
jgi:hypothetical protein